MKRVISLIIVILLFCALIPVSQADYSLDVGKNCDILIASIPHKYDGTGAYIPYDPTYFPVISGTLPDGTYITHDDTNIYLSGTPTRQGSFSKLWGTMIFKYTDLSGNEQTAFENFNIGTIYVKSPYSPAPAPCPTYNPNPWYPGGYKLTITKSPTDESPAAYGNALFVAAAVNETSMQWQLHTPNWGISYLMPQEAYKFPGLTATTYMDTQGRYVLSLKGIDPSLYGYHVNALFNGVDNVPTLTGFATIYVHSNSYYNSGSGSSSSGSSNTNSSTAAQINTNMLQSPIINTQPVSVSATIGNPTSLAVAATNLEGELKYEWYVSDSPSTEGMIPTGYSGAFYTVPQTEGVKYYTVGLWSEKDGKRSNTVYSIPASVTYTQPAPTPTPSPTASPSDVATPSPQVIQQGSDISQPKVSRDIKIALIMALLISFIILLLVLLYIKRNEKSSKNNDNTDDDDIARNNQYRGYGNTVTVQCPRCSVVSNLPANSARFCPNCSSPFNVQ